jgi:hypothetical protein
MATTLGNSKPSFDATVAVPPSASTWETQCLNCGSTLNGPFCSHCGQRAAPPHPTLHELGGDALNEFAGWDGKFAETLRLLLKKPGQLTLDFLEGKRARYISPLRLYLSCSVVYFLIEASTPNARVTTSRIIKGNDTTITRSGNASAFLTQMTPEEAKAILDKESSAPKILRPMVHRLATDPNAYKNAVFEAAPKALFALLPVFALILTLFYRGRRFAEHLYFAFHVHAFAFAALSISDAVKFTGLSTMASIAGLIAMIWVPVYWHLAFRRVYGGSFVTTLLKETGVGFLYSVASVPAIVLLALWVASH